MPSAEGRPVSPRALRLARQAGVDLVRVRGSGPGGRILAADVAAGRAAMGSAIVPSRAEEARARIARRTSESVATIPQFQVQVEVDASALVRLREALRGRMSATITDLLLRAMARALRELPAANAIWREERVIALPTIAMGLVVAQDDGLAIPVVPSCPSFADFASARAQAVAGARAGRPAGGACASTLSCITSGRIDAFSAIVPLGQSSILAAGPIAPRPWVESGTFQVRETIHLCLSADHRVLDGLPAAAYLGRIAEHLERPAALLEDLP